MSEVALYVDLERRAVRTHRLRLLRLTSLVIAVAGTLAMCTWCLVGEIPPCDVCGDNHYWQRMRQAIVIIATSGASLCFWLAGPGPQRQPLYVRLRPGENEFAQPVPLGWQP